MNAAPDLGDKVLGPVSDVSSWRCPEEVSVWSPPEQKQ